MTANAVSAIRSGDVDADVGGRCKPMTISVHPERELRRRERFGDLERSDNGPRRSELIFQATSSLV
jgi:hypothetical protein